MKIEVRDIIDRIKKIKKFTNDKEVAEALGVNHNTLRGWLQRNSLQFEIIINYAKNNYVDLNYLFSSSFTGVADKSSPARIALDEAIVASESENDVAEYLKNYTLEKIFYKLFPNEKNNKFFAALFETLVPKSERLLLFFYKVISHIDYNLEDQNDIKNPKAYLIGKINDFNLISLENLGHGFTSFDKKKLISKVELLDDKEIQAILQNIRTAIPLLHESLSLLNKINY